MGFINVKITSELSLHKINRTPLDKWFNRVIKRTCDIVSATIIVLLLWPLILSVYIITAIKSDAPALFKQKRIGRNNIPFVLYKYRSMLVNDSSDTAWSTENDVRVTKWGHTLRSTSIDELPQVLFNVLFGSMSLIGPRPEIPYHVDRFNASIPFYNERHRVKPGIAGLAQIHGLKGDTSIEQRVKYDIYYIEHWSLWMDIKISYITCIQIIKSIFRRRKI